jgi:glycosyltransferase involved in cell wall biosynthesis
LDRTPSDRTSSAHAPQALSLSVVMPVYNERHLVEESIRRVLALHDARLAWLELICVDDGSTDGSRDILRRVAAAHPERMRLIELPRNQGKGAAVAEGVRHARGDLTVIQDADLEYDPRDLPKLMAPFVEEGADAVFGSRFLSGEYRRVLYWRHSLANRFLTLLTSALTDLNLTDMETCYKMARTRLLQSIPLRSRDFRLEPELVFKLSKRGARIYEVPIRYSGRTYDEGKKIKPFDGVLALHAMVKWWLVDDIYADDEHGSHILQSLAGTPRFNRWMGAVIRPHLGSKVLEIGAGLGNLTRRFTPRERYTATDLNPLYLDYLRGTFRDRPYLDVHKCDLLQSSDFDKLEGRYDTVVCLNVLEHVEDEHQALLNMARALEQGGKAVVLVPQNQNLYGTLDEVLEHKRRYSRDSLAQALAKAGFELETMFDFNRPTTPGWWWNGRVLKRRRFGKVQLKALDWSVWWLRRLDRFLPWHGVSLVAVAKKR